MVSESQQTKTPRNTGIRSPFFALIAVSSVLLIGVNLLSLKYGSMVTLFRHLNGHKMWVGNPETNSVGLENGNITIEIPVTNCGRDSFVVTGMRSTCTCVNPTNLPLTVLPFTIESVRLTYSNAKSSPERQTVTLLVDFASFRNEVSLPLAIPSD